MKYKKQALLNFSEHMAAYIAGFVDGDGYVGIRSTGKSNNPLPCVQMTQRNPAVLHYIKSHIGAGYIYKGRGGQAKLEIKGYKLTHQFIGRLRPYLFVKADVADLILATPIRIPGKRQIAPVAKTIKPWNVKMPLVGGIV